MPKEKIRNRKKQVTNLLMNGARKRGNGGRKASQESGANRNPKNESEILLGFGSKPGRTDWSKISALQRA